jgi:hypothetical protein
MKVAEIKNLIRYCITKGQEKGITISTGELGFNVFWCSKNKIWITHEPENVSLCPLSIVLLIKQVAPSPENVTENYRMHPVALEQEVTDFKKKALRHLLKYSDYRLFPELLAVATIQEILGVSKEFVHGFLDGSQPVVMHGKEVRILPLNTDYKPGWQVGLYIYERLHKDKEIKRFYDPVLKAIIDHEPLVK